MKYPYRFSNLDGDILTDYIDLHTDVDNEETVLSLDFPHASGPLRIYSSDYHPVPYLPRLTETELFRRLPEIQLISLDDLRQQVIEIILEEFPSYYWTVPASGSGTNHPKDERGIHGQWVHTKRVVSVFDHLSQSARSLNEYSDSRFDQIEYLDYSISEYEYSCGLVASILHDIFKFGRSATPKDNMDPKHDLTAAKYLSVNYNLPHQILGCIKSHNGPWGNGTSPRTHLELLVHLSDMVASDYKAELLLIEPTQEIIFSHIKSLLENHPDVPEHYNIVIQNSQ